MKSQRSRSQHPGRKEQESPIEELRRGKLFKPEEAIEPVSCQLKRVDANSDQSFEDQPKRLTKVE